MNQNNALRYPLTQGRFINRFLQTALFETPEHFQKTTMTGKINQWLKFGFSIHDNPCRKEFLARMLAHPAVCPDMRGCAGQQEIACPGGSCLMTPHLPHGNVNVDRSGFWHVPTSLVSWYAVWLECPEALSRLPATLSTCGGATLWLNGKEVTSFRPFTRNMVKHQEITLELEAGSNLLCVCLEDLAERDTDYYFRLEVPEHTPITLCLPMAPQVDTAALLAAEAVLDNAFVHLDHDFDGSIHLDVENTANMPLNISCAVEASDIASIQEKDAGGAGQEFLLTPGEREILLREARPLPPGYYGILLTAQVPGYTVSRRISAELTRRRFMEPLCGSFDQRKGELLRFAAEESPKNTYRAVAVLARQGDPAEAERCLLRDLPGIELHKDCSDFYLIAQLYVLSNHRAQLSAGTVARMEEAILHFRYWIDEPGNDVMWFFSENHALLFHACEYVAGGMFPDSVFSASGLTGRQARAKAEGLLNGWFDDFEREFMTEWNSNAYLPIDTLAFGYLYLLTGPEEPLHQRAKGALDSIFHCLALYGHKNSFASSYGRSYEKQLKGNLVNGPASLLYYAYGKGMITSETGAYVPLCISDYQPPQAEKRFLSLAPGEVLWTGRNQGYEEHVNLTLYKTASVLLSTANAFKPYAPGYQEHIVQATIDAHAQCFVNHPGETHAFGSGRPSYWAGNGVLPLAAQWRNTALARYRLPSEVLAPFTHAYFPFEAFDRVLSGEDWYCGEKDGGYLYVWALQGLSRQTQGPYQREELLSPGLENLWVVRVGDAASYASLERFAQASACRLLRMDEREAAVEVAELGPVTLQETPAALNVQGETHACDYRGPRAFLTLETVEK